MTKKCVYVVEIWWEMARSSEWLIESHFRRKKDAAAYKKRMKSSCYKFRIVKYVSTKND
jgi:hypothetical protein